MTSSKSINKIKSNKVENLSLRLKARAILLGFISIFSLLGVSDSSPKGGSLNTDQVASCESHDKVNISENIDAEEFVSKYGQIALSVEQKYGVPQNVVLAMAIHESDYGDSELAKNANNFHGLKVNDEWHGDYYEKLTTEVISDDSFSEYDMVGSPRDLGNSNYEITVIQKFKKFSSVQEGFMGFGDYLRNRFSGQAYADSFQHTDPVRFLNSLFDQNGAVYATDPAYIEKIDSVLKSLSQEKCLVLEYQETSWDDLPVAVKNQFGNDILEYKKTMNNIKEVELTNEAYDSFISSIQDISQAVKQSQYFDSRLFPTGKTLNTTKPRVTLHYTAWPESAWSLDGMGFVSSVYHNGINNGIWGAANWYLSKDGKTLYFVTEPGQVANHSGSQYSNSTIGIETPALVQSDITPAQYEGLIYSLAWQWKQNYGPNKPTYDDAKIFVIGHGEITELTDAGGDHRDMPRPVADAIAKLLTDFLNSR
jgi:flagellum-specific peptidoglycan hydrolase FlgJ